MAGKSQASDAIEKFSRQPAPVKLGVFLGLALALGLGYWYVFYSDLSDQHTALMSTRRKLADEEKKLQQRKKEFLELIKKKAELEAELAKNAVKLPSSSELPAFFVHLQTQAVAASVRVMKWDRVNEIAVENFVKVPVTMTVKGDYYQLLQYFLLLGETQRIISVENLSLGAASNEGDNLVMTANFTASTFRQADAPPEVRVPRNPSTGNVAAAPAGAAPGGAPVTPANAAGATNQPPVRN
jgi:type IV pilus assembly protein PilO